MDEVIIKFYRRLLKEDFPNAGALDNAAVFVEAVGEKLIHCGNTGNYMQLYIQVVSHHISNIKYLCSCEPEANIAVEILCTLVKGRTLDEATSITEDAFYQFLGTRGEKLSQKVRGLLELLNEGIAHHQAQTGAKELIVKDGEEQRDKLNWDGALST